MRAPRHVALIVGLSAAVLTAQSPQEPARPPAQPTFRGGASYVRVDLHVTTKDGTPVTDLRPDDIQLLEDGAPQRIEDFEHVQVRTGTPQAARVEPNTVEASRQMAADPRARVFVVFLDTYHTQIDGSANMRLPLVRFLDSAIGPDDVVAVMTPEMSAAALTFSRKTTLLSNMMDREWTWSRRGGISLLDEKEALYEACYARQDERALLAEIKARRRERLSLDALADLVTALQGVRDERKAILTVSEGWRMFGPSRELENIDPDRAAAPLGPFERARSGEAGRQPMSGSSQTECDADRLALARMDHRFQMRDLVDAANRSNVTFYPVYPRGLAPFDSPIGPEPPPTLAEDSANLRARQTALRDLAAGTDGTAIINTNAIEAGIRRIVEDLSSYYLLGYYSTNTKLDGRFRSIRVQVNRPDLVTRARRGYRGPTAEDVMARGAGPAAAPAAAATAAPPVVVNARAPFRIRTAAWASASEQGTAASVWLVGELDFATRRDLSWGTGGTADVTVVSSAGESVTSFTVPVPAAEGAFSVPLSSTRPLPAGEYAVRVRITPTAGDTLPLSDLIRVIVPAQPSALGEAIMLRRGSSTGPRYVPTADPRFQRSDRLRLEVPTRVDGTATARLLDRTGTSLKVPVTLTERADEAGGFRWIVADAALAPLAAGDYALEVTVGGATRLTSFRLVP